MTEVLQVQQEEPKQNGDVHLSVDIDSQQNLLNGSSYKRRNTSVESVDPDAQEMLISSLRTQIQDLFAQVSQLNSKLVKSYDRVSDLEDDLHVASANLRSSSLKISHLELERTQHLSALNTGLLVEKSHVTTELNRLMEKATEEAAQRGQAESARAAIEKELDDLSASLFDQANTMVAEARFAKHLSERKVEDAERALKSAEEAVQLMQVQMQSMQADKEEMEQKSRKMEMVVNKGKWVERQNDDISVTSLRLLNSHAPYQDYLAFLSHLRVLHLNSPCPPTMTTLLPLPFLARLLNEDTEPTVRLDLAPSLNWLSRRSVLTAIHSGQLTIEPISAASLLTESSPYASSTTVAGVYSSNDNISCALCGTPIFPVTEPSHTNRSPTIPSNINPTSWSGSFFKRTTSMGYIVNSRPPSPPHPTTLSSIDFQIHIFKLASLQSSTISSLPPIPSLSKSSSQSTSSSISLQSSSIHNGLPSSSPNNQSVTIYPLCRTGWCLSRLRTTCTLWAFVRTGIVDKVWEEAITLPTPPPVPSPTTAEKPPLPPRKRGLWGIASAIGERAASWSEGDKDKTRKLPFLQPQEQRKSLVTLPQQRDQPVAVVPPPLPKRNRNSAITSSLPKANIENTTNIQTISPASTAVPVSSTVPSTTTSSTTTTTVPSSVPTLPPVQETPDHVRTSSMTTLPPVQETPVPVRTSTYLPALPERSSIRTSPPTIIDRALTPSNVPLPESRPSTPPVRTASPAAIGRSVGAPPPLPRRAVSRGVKSNAAVVAAAAAASVSRSGTPVNGLEGVKGNAAAVASVSRSGTPVNGVEGVKGNVVAAATSVSRSGTPVNGVEGVKGNAAVVASVSRSGTPVNGVEGGEGNASATAAAPAASVSRSGTPVNGGVKGNAAAVASVSRSGTPVNGRDESVAKKANQALETEEVNNNKDQFVGNGSLVVEEEKKTTRSGTPVNDRDESAVKRANLTLETEEMGNNNKGQYVADGSLVVTRSDTPVNGLDESVAAKKAETFETEDMDDNNKGQYVGDGSWEEKTWKELVRLREDMFWARLGGIRG